MSCQLEQQVSSVMQENGDLCLDGSSRADRSHDSANAGSAACHAMPYMDRLSEQAG